jgi:hypothetical protein
VQWLGLEAADSADAIEQRRVPLGVPGQQRGSLPRQAANPVTMTACDVGVPCRRRPSFGETTDQCKGVTDRCNPVALSVRSRYTCPELTC